MFYEDEQVVGNRAGCCKFRAEDYQKEHWLKAGDLVQNLLVMTSD